MRKLAIIFIAFLIYVASCARPSIPTPIEKRPNKVIELDVDNRGAVSLVYGRRPVKKIPKYWRSLYKATEDCVKWKGNFDGVSWFYADSIYFGSSLGDTIYAAHPYDAWVSGKLSRARGMWMDHVVVFDSILGSNANTFAHETIHDILKGGVDHPSTIFNVCAPPTKDQ